MATKAIVLKSFNTAETIGEIQSDFLPQVGHKVWYGDVIYTVEQVLHKQDHAGSLYVHPIVYLK